MTKIKICGLMRDCDVDYVNEACPEYVGFVFAHTRREISAEDARRFRKNLRKEIQAVGVFVDEKPERVAWLLQEGIIDIAQLHGSEDAAYVEWLKSRTGCVVIKALHPEKMLKRNNVVCQDKMQQRENAVCRDEMQQRGNAVCQDEMQQRGNAVCQDMMLQQNNVVHQDERMVQPNGQTGSGLYEDYRKAGVDYFLFDSSSRTQAGGTGKTFDWSLIPEGGHPFFLAGGLRAENIEEAVRVAAPYAVDISSGVETDGFKDRDKILEIVRRVRNV